jgi:hypothetical protein
MIDGDDCEAISWMNEWRGNPKYSEETCPSAILTTAGPTWLDPGSKPDRGGEKPVINRLRYCVCKNETE